ncbi:MAG: exodeoxyribonuclease V subunit gamma [Gemmatimonadota bacterium]
MSGTIQLYTASRLTPLIAHLTEVVRATPLSPLEPETIVVQSQGMRRWVTLQLADRLGCAGSLQLPFPAGFIHELARRVDPSRSTREAEEAFSRDTLAWRVEALLRELPGDDVHEPLHRYLRGNDERARFGLAARIADRFDDYQLYRADLLAAWEQGADTPGTAHARWQAALWRALCADRGAAAAHAGARLRHLIDLLQGAPPRGLPTRVTVFGISTLPPLFVDVLAALARHLPVSVYTAALTATTPHPLAQAFGGQGRDFIDALRSHGATHTLLPDPQPRHDTLLGTLQRELESGSAGTARVVPAITDHSLRIHSAHGEMRQLEIIRDQLLHALQSDPALRPHDLLLLVPDAATWAPLVDAVFGVNEPGAPRIPYRIADRPARGDDPAASALASLLALQGGRFTHSELFELLAQPLVHEAAGLNEAQVEALATLTHRANARWGYDAASRVALGLPAYEDASWRAALDRLLLGMTTGPHPDLVLELLPQSGDTIGDGAGLARLAEWVDAVSGIVAQWTDPRPLNRWADALDESVMLLFGAPGERNADAVSGVTRLLDRLRSQALAAEYGGDVSFGVVRDWVDAELEGDGFGSGFLTGGMTVAALKPMRSLPFRVIAVAGLDEAVFPRRDRRAAFDMLDAEHRAGDRDLRSDDRQLFLDLMLAAGDRLVLAYSGRAVSDNAPCASSVVLDELLDHLDRRSGGSARRTVLVEHPLQPFSPRYFEFDGDSRLFTFSSAQARTASASRQERAADLPFVTAPIVPLERATAPTFELTIAELADCWCNASRYFCRHALGFTLSASNADAGDDELLTLDKMEQGSVKARLLAAGLRGDVDPARDLRRLQGAGALPPARLGEAWNAVLREGVDAVLQALPPDTPRQVPVSVAVGDWRVSGTLDGVRGQSRYVVRAGRFRAPHEVRAWVEHVVMCAAAQQSGGDVPQHTVLLGFEEKAKQHDAFAAIPDALASLEALVREAQRGRQLPLAIFPQASVKWRDAQRGNRKLRKGSAPKDPRREAIAAYETDGGFGAPAGDHADEHVALCFRGQDPMTDRWTEFEALATTLFAPLLPAGGP